MGAHTQNAQGPNQFVTENVLEAELIDDGYLIRIQNDQVLALAEGVVHNWASLARHNGRFGVTLLPSHIDDLHSVQSAVVIDHEENVVLLVKALNHGRALVPGLLTPFLKVRNQDSLIYFPIIAEERDPAHFPIAKEYEVWAYHMPAYRQLDIGYLAFLVFGVSNLPEELIIANEV